MLNLEECIWSTHDHRKKDLDVVVLFQRYSDCDNVWAFASNSVPISGQRLNPISVHAFNSI